MLRCELKDLSETMREHKLWKHTVFLVGPALAEGPLATRSHLYHPGFRHEYRDGDGTPLPSPATPTPAPVQALALPPETAP